jgi:holo-ACP synthase / triphosphoribosyl-dephospho-CoA synthase
VGWIAHPMSAPMRDAQESIASRQALEAVLEARERRTALRQALVGGGRVLISLSLNIPGWPKTDPLSSEVFARVRGELTRFLAAHLLYLDPGRLHDQADAAGDFFLAALRLPAAPAGEVKQITERFEARHPLGRIIDVDVSIASGEPISSRRAKPCLLCPDRPAIVCMREGAHPTDELRGVVRTRMAAYLIGLKRESVCRCLAATAARAMLYEVAHTPKPGLVDRAGVGSHDDMDFFTFLDSSAAISGAFFDLATLGYDDRGEDLDRLLPELRVLGLAMEEAMFAATGDVNTQRGLIFLLALALVAAGRTLAEASAFSPARFREIVRRICAGMVARELGPLAEAGRTGDTHGASVFQRFGLPLGGGVRAEAEAGFPTVFETGLPALEAEARTGLPHRGDADMQTALDAALFALIAANPDSNVLHRGGAEALTGLQQRARALCAARQPTARSAARAELFEFVARHRLSPGGSADLLALTLFLYFVKRSFPDGL